MSNFRIIFLLLLVKQTVMIYIKQRGAGEGGGRQELIQSEYIIKNKPEEKL